MGATADFVAAVEKIQAAIAEAVASKDADLFVSLYTPDGALMTPDGSIIAGRQAMAEAFSRFTAAGWVGQEAELGEVLVADGLATGQERTTGTFVVDGVTSQVRNNCLLTYVQDESGRWLIHRDIWNTVDENATGGY